MDFLNANEYMCIIDFYYLQIQDSKGHILSQKDDIPHGKLLKFSFVTETYDTFEICFTSHVPNRMYIYFCKFNLSFKSFL